jgi:predicted aminopeptidase
MLTESCRRQRPAGDLVRRGQVRVGSRTRSALAGRALLLLAVCALLPGCGTLYVMQAATGEWRVLRARVPIDRVITDPRTPPELRSRLAEVRQARAFAVSDLGLPANRSYTTYADIDRPYVVWNVVATPEFSVQPEHWCFPVAGCVAYRGYFNELRARDFAYRLAQRGSDVVVEGVPAYSTLGKFADPVLSSMLRYGEDDLVATIFHELAHQLLYVRNDTEFNEAFAMTVEDVGLERWLKARGAADRIREFHAEQARSAALIALLIGARERLAALYASGRTPAEMRAAKARILATLAADIQAQELREGVRYPVYDEWIMTGLNNAQLASVASYYECQPGFRRLLESEGGDLQRFYAAVRQLAHATRAERHARLCDNGAPPSGAARALELLTPAQRVELRLRVAAAEVGRQDREHALRPHTQARAAVLAAYTLDAE